VSLPKRTSDLLVPFRQIPPSSKSLGLPKWWLQRQRSLLLGVGRRRNSCQGNPEGPPKGPCLAKGAGATPAPEGLSSTRLGAEGRGLSC
jgi:hypothetical protein